MFPVPCNVSCQLIWSIKVANPLLAQGAEDGRQASAPIHPAGSSLRFTWRWYYCRMNNHRYFALVGTVCKFGDTCWRQALSLPLWCYHNNYVQTRDLPKYYTRASPFGASPSDGICEAPDSSLSFCSTSALSVNNSATSSSASTDGS